jgi:hypothetical protein
MIRLAAYDLPDPHRSDPERRPVLCRAGDAEPIRRLDRAARVWGRRGSPGNVWLSSYQRRNEAEAAEHRTIKRRLQRGYAAI